MCIDIRKIQLRISKARFVTPDVPWMLPNQSILHHFQNLRVHHHRTKRRMMMKMLFFGISLVFYVLKREHRFYQVYQSKTATKYQPSQNYFWISQPFAQSESLDLETTYFLILYKVQPIWCPNVSLYLSMIH